MGVEDFLTLTGVTVRRVSEISNGKGGKVSTTATTVLSKAMIFQSNASGRYGYFSDRLNRNSTHTLVCEPSAYSWDQNDREVIYDGFTYKIIDRPDNVLYKGEIMVVALELLT